MRPRSPAVPYPRPPAFVYSPSLHCERAAIEALAQRHGTPLYLYAAGHIRDRYRTFDKAFAAIPHTICYSVKANPNLSILKLLFKLGSGFDVVSGGELQRVLEVSRSAAARVVFSGVGKTAHELDLALKSNILLFNVESEGELDLLAHRAVKLKKTARIALRVNPDVPADTHPYISTGLREHKFGIDIREARRIYARAATHGGLDVAGVSVHIGSQITAVAPFAAAMDRVAALIRDLTHDGHTIRYVDAGGGLGIPYQPAGPSDPATRDPHDAAAFSGTVSAYSAALIGALTHQVRSSADKERLSGARASRGLSRFSGKKPPAIHLLLEPGRAIIAPAGALITRVLYLKSNGSKRFVVVDAAMNDLIRPSLYGAYHEIVPVASPAASIAPAEVRSAAADSINLRTTFADSRSVAALNTFDVVGPICETGDFFARDRPLPPLAPGDLLAILDTGAYGMSLASNYNTRGRPAEVLVDRGSAKIIRRRESISDQLRLEKG